MRATLTRVLQACGLARHGAPAGVASLPPKPRDKTDCDFDPDAWDCGGRTALAAAGVSRVVLSRMPLADAPAWPSTEGTPAWRAVIAVPDDITKASLARLHASGVRGVRFNLTASSLDPMSRLADQIVPLGWHVEIRIATPEAARTLPKAEGRLMQFPVAVCFSGIGSADRSRRADDPLEHLLSLVKLGRYWVKLSSSDLAPPQLPLWDELPSLAHVLRDVRKDRLIWGSGSQRDGGAAQIGFGLAMLEKCLPHPADQEQVLVDNPARLYGFGNV